MTEEADGMDGPSEDRGITDEDMERIAAFLKRPQYDRSVDDLRPSSEK